MPDLFPVSVFHRRISPQPQKHWQSQWHTASIFIDSATLPSFQRTSSMFLKACSNMERGGCSCGGERGAYTSSRLLAHDNAAGVTFLSRRGGKISQSGIGEAVAGFQSADLRITLVVVCINKQSRVGCLFELTHHLYGALITFFDRLDEPCLQYKCPTSLSRMNLLDCSTKLNSKCHKSNYSLNADLIQYRLKT